MDLPLSHLDLSICRSGEDGRWQWSYSSWEETGLTSDLEDSYHSDLGCGDRFWTTSGLAALVCRLSHDAAALVHPERF